MKRTAMVAVAAAVMSISISTGARIIVGAQADTITIIVRLILPFLIAVPLALIGFTYLEKLENSYLALLSKTNELARQASVDPLTGLLNRRSFIRQFELAVEHRVSGLFLIADVDYLKTINDFFGHPVGDKAILSIAAALRGVLGDKSLIARIGGDEFCAFVPLTSRQASSQLQLAINTVATRLFREATGLEAEAVTLSVGAVPLAAGLSFDDAILAADAALYSQKRERPMEGNVSPRRRSERRGAAFPLPDAALHG